MASATAGVHCLKYCVTANNITGLEIVTIEGEIIRIGGKFLDIVGYDFLAAITGSEGLLGVVTEITTRVIPKPDTAQAMMIGFASIDAAANAVSAILAAGIIPTGLELMDRLCVEAVNAFMDAGYPRDIEALMLIELDGDHCEIAAFADQVEGIVARAGCVHIRRSNSDAERLALWSGRKAAFRQWDA